MKRMNKLLALLLAVIMAASVTETSIAAILPL